MKRTFICLLAALAVTSAGALAAPAAATEITASGTGSVSMPPDTATVSAGIETNAENANEAISQSNALYDRIVASLAKLGIARGDVSLAYYNVSYNPRPRSAPVNPGERYGYTVSRNFSVKVRDIGKAGAVSDACTAAGATTINGVNFGLADPTAARSQATIKAVVDARSNAETLARAAGLHVTAIKSIELGGGPPPGPVPMLRMAAAAPSPPTEFDTSNVNVTVSVSVVFLAEP
jgi:uncharacterized protein